jgi:hypothetical protein
MDGNTDHHAELDKPKLKGQISCPHSFVQLRPKMMMMMVMMTIMGHKCKYKWKLVYGGTAEEGGEERKHY